MIRVVLDTNVFVSALLTPDSPPAKILAHALEGSLRIIISPGIIREISSVFQYPKLKKSLEKRGLASEELLDAIIKILHVATITPGAVLARGISRDPADDMVLSCAIEGKADFIISGDHHLTELNFYEEISIVSPSAFLRLIAPENET